MRYLLTGKEAQAIDRYTMEQMGVPSLVLMERAALEVARVAEREAKGLNGENPLSQVRIQAVCGTGNNGADGVAAARILFLKGYNAGALILGDPGEGSKQFQKQLQIARSFGMPVYQAGEEQPLKLKAELVIDAIFGVGLSREVGGMFADWVRRINEERAAGKIRRVIAVDLPSGIHGGSGQVMGTAVKADVTVTFGWEKRGSVLYPGRDYAGQVETADIGFSPAAVNLLEEIPACAYGPEDLARIPERKAYSNKGTFGRVLIVAGSANMCGAAFLCALGAYRMGAGLVKVLTVEENRQPLLQLLPEVILETYTESQLMEGREEFRQMIDAQCQWADVVILGPGLGSKEYVEYLVEDILTAACTPVVVDADGLNAIAAHPYLTSYFTENLIITPHLGEMSRLTGEPIAQMKQDTAACAKSYALRYGLTCVLKDAATVVASRDGEIYINTSGNSAMAKAGSGDVLAGVIGGLLALGMEEKESARLGVYLHGRAGDLAAARSGPHGLLARELADGLTKAAFNRGE